MVATKYNKKTHVKLLAKTPDDYTILHTPHIAKRDIPRFTYALEMVNVLHAAIKRNEVFDGLGIENKICKSHFSDAIDYILSDCPLGKTSLREYFTQTLKLGEFQQSMSNLYHVDYYIPFAIEFMFLGMPFDTYHSLGKERQAALDDLYFDLYSEFAKKEIDVHNFIDKALDLVKSYQPKPKYDEVVEMMKSELEKENLICQQLDEIKRKMDNNEPLTSEEQKLLDA